MTAYVAQANTGDISISITPVSYEVRVARIDLTGAFTDISASASSPILVGGGYTVSGTTGGTSVTPRALRQGATAASTTAKSGTTYTAVTSTWFSEYVSGVSTAFNNGSGTNYCTTAGNVSWQPPFDLILSPGTILWASMTGCLGGFIYFEELRLSWPY